VALPALQLAAVVPVGRRVLEDSTAAAAAATAEVAVVPGVESGVVRNRAGPPQQPAHNY